MASLRRTILLLENSLVGAPEFLGLEACLNKCKPCNQDFFFQNLLPFIVESALALPELIPATGVPLLLQDIPAVAALSDLQVLAIIANMFLGTIRPSNENALIYPISLDECPSDDGSGGSPQPIQIDDQKFNNQSFFMMFSSSSRAVQAKLSMVINYFLRSQARILGSIRADQLKTPSTLFPSADVHLPLPFEQQEEDTDTTSSTLSLVAKFYASPISHSQRRQVYFRRRVLDPTKMSSELLDNSDVIHQPLCHIRLSTPNQPIESSYDTCAQVDFANRLIGGGVLRNGCVQEEIRFCNCPETLVALCLCSELKHTEALCITGAEFFTEHEGYASSLEFKGDLVQETLPIGFDCEFRCHKLPLIAIDATIFGCASTMRLQIQKEVMNRDIIKAIAGFSDALCLDIPSHFESDSRRYPAVCTGNWGCGAFGGNSELKLLIQWIAASISGRSLVYCPFDQVELIAKFDSFQKVLKTVGPSLSSSSSSSSSLEGSEASEDSPATIRFLYNLIVKLRERYDEKELAKKGPMKLLEEIILHPELPSVSPTSPPQPGVAQPLASGSGSFVDEESPIPNLNLPSPSLWPMERSHQLTEPGSNPDLPSSLSTERSPTVLEVSQKLLRWFLISWFNGTPINSYIRRE